MLEPVDTQTVNDDLLMNVADRDAASVAFPTCFHLLDHPELRTLFQQCDAPANAAKARSRRAGIAAVVLAVCALWGAAAAPLYEPLSPPVPALLAGLFAALGITSAAVGLGGLMFSRSKKEWLYRRLITERLRQFHFQTLPCRLALVAESFSSPEGKHAYLAERRKWLAAFELRFRNRASSEFAGLLQSEEFSGVWLHPAPTPPSESLLARLPEELFVAYRELRIRHQLQFAATKLKASEGLLFGWDLRAQQQVLSHGGLIATVALTVAEFLVLVAVVFHVEAFPSALAHIFAVWCAIVALALRTLDEGLRPRQELERYQRYRVAAEDMLARYDAQEARAGKIDIMVEMERLSFQEMCDFLRANDDARFVM